MTAASDAQLPAAVSVDVQRLGFWDTLKDRGRALAFDLELTARCNLDCRHCYINLPAGDREAQSRELPLSEIERLAREAVSLGALWCLITGGEPLLRGDFPDIYRMLKRQGLLVSVFTNACLVTAAHASLFRDFPPRDIEVTVYGATDATYERITRRKGSYSAFRRGLELLQAAGVRVRLKAMFLRSNFHERREIIQFVRRQTKDYARFDPILHLRYDGDSRRNAEILAERLLPQEIVAFEQSDADRWGAMEKRCRGPSAAVCQDRTCRRLFHCGAGRHGFTVGYEGTFRLCSSLCRPGMTFDLRHGSLAEARQQVVPAVLRMEQTQAAATYGCHHCNLAGLCPWCPAHALLETGQADREVDYFCRVAQARAAALKLREGPAPQDSHGT